MSRRIAGGRCRWSSRCSRWLLPVVVPAWPVVVPCGFRLWLRRRLQRGPLPAIVPSACNRWLQLVVRRWWLHARWPMADNVVCEGRDHKI